MPCYVLTALLTMTLLWLSKYLFSSHNYSHNLAVFPFKLSLCFVFVFLCKKCTHLKIILALFDFKSKYLRAVGLFAFT